MKNKIDRLLLITMSILFLSFLHEPVMDCTKIKNGKFYYYTKKNRERINILRTDSLQIERGANQNEDPIKSKVIWKGDCEYDMYLNAFSDGKLNETDSIIASTPAHVQIVYIAKAFYVCTIKFNAFNSELNLRDTIYFTQK